MKSEDERGAGECKICAFLTIPSVQHNFRIDLLCKAARERLIVHRRAIVVFSFLCMFGLFLTASDV